jgi:hypothetical protein
LIPQWWEGVRKSLSNGFNYASVFENNSGKVSCCGIFNFLAYPSPIKRFD